MMPGPTRSGLVSGQFPIVNSWRAFLKPRLDPLSETKLGTMARKLLYLCAWMAAAAVYLTAQFLLIQGIPVSQQLGLGQVQPAGGQAYLVQLERVSRYLAAPSDDMNSPQRSNGLVLENGRPLGPAHSLHDTIRQHGGGLFSHWQNWLIFSARDGSDPRQNGRTYTFEARHFLVEPYRTWANLAVAAFAAFLTTVAIITLGRLVRKWIRVALERPIILDRTIRRGAAIAFLLSAICFYGSFLGVSITVSIEPNSIQPSEGHAYAAPIEAPFWFLWTPHDRLDDPFLSSMVLRENGVLLGPAHAQHVLIHKTGGGAFSHWQGQLVFSSRDNSDPRQNGRSYTARAAWLLVKPVNEWVLFVASGLAVVSLWLSLLALARSGMISILGNVLLVAGSVILFFLGVEGVLWLYAATHKVQPLPPVAVVPAQSSDEIVIPTELAAAASSRQQVISMPETWKRTAIETNGSIRMNYWHGVLHIYNEDGMRWATPFPPRRDHVYRVMVVGDSLTYGDGLPEERRFSNLLDRWMSQEFRIEFLNVGVDGAQSEDILRIINRYLPILNPNLVIYGVCINDFLPSGRRESEKPLAYPFPLPDFLIRETLTGAFLSENYDGALRRLHLREDFIDDVLRDLEGYQQRFTRDVADMNRSIGAAGLPPMIGMVLFQRPKHGDRAYQMAKIAESALAQAGAVVIPSEDYFKRYHGQAMNISRWEGHPNEVANYIWANMIAKELQNRRDLVPFKK
jgi:GDSL-like Lipase/Acylhydrolase family